ncbi:MAG: DUF4143 domain-containing protein [Dermatophilaceae bacterium]
MESRVRPAAAPDPRAEAPPRRPGPRRATRRCRSRRTCPRHGHPRAARAGTWLGALFESLVTQSVRVYAAAADAHVGHRRTKTTEHEVNLVVEGDGMRTVAIEVKLAATVDDADVRHLHWLRSRLGDRLVDRVVVTTGEHAYRRRDGVAVVPLALLGP